MCGIVGYTGKQQAAPILIAGLSKLEYRGYDSAGVAVLDPEIYDIVVEKSKGRLKILSDKIDGGKSLKGNTGIGHTRWATHGEPSDVNSHPHTSDKSTVVVVHNGIIENYLELGEKLKSKGVVFDSETDSEVIAHLIEYYYDGDILKTISKVINRLEGSYAIGIMFKEHPNEIYAVRKDSPLIAGLTSDGNFIASDIPAVLPYTRDVYLLNEKIIAKVTSDSVELFDMDGEPVTQEIYTVDWDVDSAEKGGYEHFMFKEIMEQPEAIRKTISMPLELNLKLSDFDRIYIVACGSAYHVGMVAKYHMENQLRIPIEVDLASEFRYRKPLVTDKTLVIVISQSGETLDTLCALREAKRLGGRILSIVNVVGSSIARESDDVIYTRAGPEIAVATTKAYITQMAVIFILTEFLGGNKLALDDIPVQIQQILDNAEQIQKLASMFYNAKHIFFLGRGVDYAVSLEGSLKLKEISYIHSEAYAAGELKHGTISLIEDGTLVVALATQPELFDKVMSNIREVKARGAVVIAVIPESKRTAAGSAVADHVIYIPESQQELTPLLSVVPLQLFSYYVASLRGCDVDKPRNLAKSVTVE
jgi:glucosamine--fructose-6-phosphate aminotransferase (isomerizing)